MRLKRSRTSKGCIVFCLLVGAVFLCACAHQSKAAANKLFGNMAYFTDCPYIAEKVTLMNGYRVVWNGRLHVSLKERNGHVLVDMFVHQEGDCMAGPTKRVSNVYTYDGPDRWVWISGSLYQRAHPIPFVTEDDTDGGKHELRNIAELPEPSGERFVRQMQDLSYRRYWL